MSRNAISANPERYILKIFRGSMPPDPARRPKKIFLAAAWLKTFFRIDFPLKQKILDRTLPQYQQGCAALASHLKSVSVRFCLAVSIEKSCKKISDFMPMKMSYASKLFFINNYQ